MKPVRILASLLVVAMMAIPTELLAYSYASPTSDPMITEREGYLDGVNKGNWQAVETAYDAFSKEIAVLERGEHSFKGDSGLAAAFTDAIGNKDAAAARAALQRAYVDQIIRRLAAANRELKTSGSDNDEAKSLLAFAQAFYTAMAGDLPADEQKAISAAFSDALDAIGRPGVLGYFSVAPDPAAMKKATDAIAAALKPSAGAGAGSGSGSGNAAN
ncbi:MAG: hypothetical protein AcusKO_43950 [Acuticoccus sp.]